MTEDEDCECAELVPLFTTERAVSHCVEQVEIELPGLEESEVVRFRLVQDPERRRDGGEAAFGQVSETEGKTRTGAVIWDAGIELCKFLRGVVKGKRRRTLELGAGCSGIVGMYVSRLGLGEEVILSDRECLLPDLKRNVERNMDINTLINVQEIIWGNDLEAKHTEQKHAFDLIVAADCVYDVSLVPILLETIDFFLSPNGICLVAYDTNIGRTKAYEAFDQQARNLCPDSFQETWFDHIKVIEMKKTKN